MALGAAMALAAGVVGALGVVELGAYDVAGSSPHTSLAFWATETTMARAVRREAGAIAAPPRFTQAQAAAGFRLYETHCVACHGAPGIGQAAASSGMMPPPPYLIDAPRRWSPAELYWIVRHGVKMTAMPAWDRTLSAEQTWSVVAFLEALPGLSYRDYCRLRNAPPGAACAPAEPGRGFPSRLAAGAPPSP